MKANVGNEKLKRNYFRWLREAKGYSESTVVAIERELSRWEEFNNHDDFGRFSVSRVVAFKKHWEEPSGQASRLSPSSRYHCLQHLRSFFQWLSSQPGHRSKISVEAISYLSLDRKTVQALNSPKRPRCASLEYARQLAGSIEIATEIDQRDRALIGFLLLSGMRDKAIATLPLGCFDADTLEVQQDFAAGVDTKFGKSSVTTLLKFDFQLISWVVEWAKHLKETKLFDGKAPLFPRCKVVQSEGGFSFESKEVEPVFWRSAGSIVRILGERAERAGLPYFNPHSFRHAHIQLALRYCRNAEQLKAVSQNVGHADVGTTLTTYGRLDQFRVSQVLTQLNLGESAGEEDDPEVQAAIQTILHKSRKKA